MAENFPVSGLETTQDERTMATLAHALMIIGGWLAPLIIFLIRRESRFVSFHAVQALLWQVIHVLLAMVFVIGWMTTILSTVFLHMGDKTPNFPIAFFFLIPLLWLFMFGVGIANLVIAIVYAIKAGRGEWAEYPVLGKLARRMLKMGPGGANLA